MAKAEPSILNKIKPAPGYLFIQPEEQASQTSSGIYLPDNAKGDKPQKGTVLAAGSPLSEKGNQVSSPAKKGEQVMYKKWGGNETKIDGKEYLFVKFEDILAVIS